ncbi:MAG: hypothetical protein ACHQHN_14795 [Sphingobacteriales bacterium]
MKKNLIVCAVLLFAFKISNAQTEKGTQTLGLDFSASRSTNNQTTANPFDYIGSATTNFTIGPNYSYFIADKLDIGTALSYQTTKQTYTVGNANDNGGYPTSYNDKNLNASVFVRKYFMYKNTIGLRTGAYFTYSYGANNSDYIGTYAASSSSGTSHNYDAQVKLDLVYYPTKNLGVSATIVNAGYSWYKTHGNNETTQSGDNASASFISDGLQLSVFYVFGSK